MENVSPVETDITFQENEDGAVDGERAVFRSLPLRDANAQVRRFPFPYKAMLAICSDLDETPDRQVYFEIMRFLNTTEQTALGRGVGLEVGNTIYFDMPQGQFAYWNTDDTGRDMVRELIRSGHIDCFHSYGDLATTREHAQRTLEELNQHNCHLKVWVDHATALTNLDGDIMKGSGDVPGSPAYHADLTLGYGVEYVWRGRVTSIIGQDVPRHFAGLLAASHPFSSGKTILKEFAKGLLGQFRNGKYEMHALNCILRQVKLRDGQKAYEFMRCNPHWSGVGLGATAFGFSDVLVDKMLQELVDRQGFCILYTHLGKIRNNQEIFNNRTIKAFSLLAHYLLEGKILVTTTQRLLRYCRAKNEASISTKITNDNFHINLFYKGTKDDLEGLTMYVPNDKQIKIWFNQKEIVDFQRHSPDQTGQTSISLPWRKMEFPQLRF